MINREILSSGFTGAGGTSQWGVLTGVRPAKLMTKLLDQGMGRGEALNEFEKLGVSPKRADLCLSAAEFSRRTRDSLAPGDILLYVGIPFCPSRCTYCSFVSNAMPGAMKLLGPFLETLLWEIAYCGQALKGSGLQIRGLYIGGGTPTTLDAAQLDTLMGALEEAFDLGGLKEYTVEAGRPDTLDGEKLSVLRRHGANRISVNPQTMIQSVLEAIGRRHSPQDMERAFHQARDTGFDLINTDLIAGLPADSFSGFRESLNSMIALGPENITIHTLSVKRGSTLNELGGTLPQGGEVSKMLDLAAAALGEAGYRPYYLYRQKNSAGGFENTGWTKPGCESVYNICMMEELCGVLALGGGGVTKMVDSATGFISRGVNPKYPYEYNVGLDKIQKAKDDFFKFYRER